MVFAANLLFGIWDGLFSKLLEKRLVIRRENADIFKEINEGYLETEDGYERWHRVTLRYGRRFAVLFELVVALILLIAGPKSTMAVSLIGFLGIIIVALPWPISFVIIGIVNVVYRIRDRTVRNFISNQKRDQMKRVRAVE